MLLIQEDWLKMLDKKKLKAHVFSVFPELSGSGHTPGCSRKILVLLIVPEIVIFALPSSESLWGLVKMQKGRSYPRPIEQESIDCLVEAVFQF